MSYMNIQGGGACGLKFELLQLYHVPGSRRRYPATGEKYGAKVFDSHEMTYEHSIKFTLTK